MTNGGDKGEDGSKVDPMRYPVVRKANVWWSKGEVRPAMG